MRAHRNKAFTFIEMILAIALISVLAAVAVPAYQEQVLRTKNATCITDISQIDIQIARFFTMNGGYPNALSDIGPVPLDPWGNAYRYLNITTVKGKGKVRKDKNLVPINSDYDLYSMGEDGRSVSPLTAKHSRDDIVRASNGAFIGLAAEY